MSMTREGAGDRYESYGGEDCAERCERCGWRPEGCTCAPCDECADVLDSGKLTWSRDGRWRCPSCQVRREIKVIAAERPAFRPSLADLYAAVVAQMVRR